MKFILIILLFVINCFGSALDMAAKAYENKDYNTAIKYWKPLAQIGDSTLQYKRTISKCYKKN
ncbi:MAG: hypothetical protein L3I99_06105 [Sulfurimonas sp.]|nr:hypothetical protein [Sulfurimonas sp.]